MAEKVTSAKKGFPKWLGITAVIVIAAIVSGIILLHHNPLADQKEEVIKKVFACGIIFVSVIGITTLYDKIMILPQELWQNRKLIWKLAKNDFKTNVSNCKYNYKKRRDTNDNPPIPRHKTFSPKKSKKQNSVS